MEDVFKRLESVDVQESARAVNRLQKKLGAARDPQLLGELTEHYLTTGSQQTLDVLTGLKDVQSQVRRGARGVLLDGRCVCVCECECVCVCARVCVYECL